MRGVRAKQVAIFLENERRVELRGPRNDELRRRSRGVQRRTGADRGKRLTSTAVCTEHIVCGDAPAAKTAIDSRDLDRFAAEQWRRDAEANLSLHQAVEMICEIVT